MTTATKKVGQPRKDTVLDGVVAPPDRKTNVHHMLRTISFSGQKTTDGSLPAEEVDADVRTWLDAGYQLFSTHYAGETTQGMRILYIFIKPE